MKLIYTTEKYKRYNLRKSQKALERLKDSQIKIKRKSSYYQQNKYYKKEILLAPENFSVLDNYNESMEFLDKVDNYSWHERRGFVDLSEVGMLTPDAVLYLLSCIDRVQKDGNRSRLSGNAPKNDYCKKVFLKSGFFKFVNSNYEHKDDLDILSIRTNELISAVDAGAVVQYVRTKFNIERNSVTRATYATIMEAMNNVREHAYEGLHNNKWWLMALSDDACERIHFSILDNGRGIPNTIRKKISDYFIGNDGELIKEPIYMTDPLVKSWIEVQV